jgi:hypothetical protein
LSCLELNFGSFWVEFVLWFPKYVSSSSAQRWTKCLRNRGLKFIRESEIFDTNSEHFRPPTSLITISRKGMDWSWFYFAIVVQFASVTYLRNLWSWLKNVDLQRHMWSHQSRAMFSKRLWCFPNRSIIKPHTEQTGLSKSRH